MVDGNVKEGPEEEGVPSVLTSETYHDLRQIAKRNLQEAERVLAESGYQLLKNTKVDDRHQDQSLEQPSQGSNKKV
jgi:hypothetical protein